MKFMNKISTQRACRRKISMHYALLIMFLMAIFIVPSASAAGLMPYHNWNPETQTATIKDYLGLETVAEIQLISNTYYCMKTCEAVIKITPNKDISADNNQEYKVLFKDLTKTKDMSDKIKKLEYFKYIGNETYYVSVDDYSESCSTLANQSQSCSSYISGSHQEARTKEIWNKIELTPSFFKKIDGSVLIKIVGEKAMGTSVDWIPKFYGVEINEMAVWQSSYNVGLQAYWTMNESTSSDAINSVDFTRNGTCTGTCVLSSGKIGNSWNSSGAEPINNYIGTGMAGSGGNTMTITAWVHYNGGVNYPTVIGKTINGARNSPEWVFTVGYNSNEKISFTGSTGGWKSADNVIPTGKWVFVAVSIDGGSGTFYVNGSADGTFSGVSWLDNDGRLRIADLEGVTVLAGSVDEIGLWNRSLSGTEISDMYNSGTGMTYKTTFLGTISIALDSPVNAFNTTASTLNFNATITPVSANITNATLYIWNNGGTLKSATTNIYSHINYTYSANFSSVSITPDANNYTWNVEACGKELLSNTYICSFGTNRTFTRDTTAPALSISSPTGNYYLPPANFTLTISMTDAGVNATTCRYSLNGAANVSIPSCNPTTSIAVPRLGNSTIIVYANDSLNNLNSSSASFYAFPTFRLCNDTIVTSSINFTTKNESNSAVLNESTFKGTFVYYYDYIQNNRTYSFDNYSDGATHEFCIYPVYSSVYANLLSEYSRGGYSTRNYVLSGHTADNTTEEIGLYMIPPAEDTDLIVRIYDGNLVIQKGIIVRMQRYYPATDTWLEVESDTSDELGQAIFHVVEKSVTYKFLLYNATNLLKTTENIKVVCYATPCTIDLTIEPTTTSQFINYVGIPGFAYTFGYNNNTNIFSYSWVDSSGSMDSTRLQVQQLNTTSSPYLCNATSTAASGTATCNISAYSGSFIATAYGTFDGTTYVIDRISATIDNRYKTFGKEGMFWAIMFLIALVMAGVWNPAVSIGMLLVGIVLIAVMGIIALPWLAVISIVILGGVVISHLKT